MKKVFICCLVSLFGCTSTERPVVREVGPQLVRLEANECRAILRDDSSLESLQQAAVRSNAYFDEASAFTLTVFGKSASRASLAAIAETAAQAQSLETFGSTMCDRVAVYRVDLSKTLSISGYSDLPLRARRFATGDFRYAVFEPPSDLVELDLTELCPTCERRLVQGRVSGSKIIPYYSRAEIEAGVLAGKDYELGWVADPVEALMLELRGAGTLEFEDGTRMNLTYASNNGRAAADPIEALLAAGKLNAASANLAGLRAYLRLHPEEAANLLRARERVNFYGVKPVGPVGSLGTPITPGRSIAADSRFYPRGMLAFVRGSGTNSLSRFVFVQDEQPGLSGAERVALFAGDDEVTGLAQLQATGEIYLILPN